MQELLKIIGYKFKDEKLLRTAMTHSSFSASESNYERLEFLGDAVVELIVTEHLYQEYELTEGEMTRVRSASVCEAALCQAAESLGIQHHLRLGKGELASGGMQKPSILADVMEAITGAIFLDGGLENAKRFVLSFEEKLIRENADNSGADNKTSLQELLQAKGQAKISYRVLDESGPDHRKSFKIAVYNGETRLGEGSGGSKKEAEQKAAYNALNQIK